MGEGGAVLEKSDAVANGNTETDNTAEAVLDKKVERLDGEKDIEVDMHHNGLKEMEGNEHNDGEKEVDKRHDGFKEIEEDEHNDVEDEVGEHHDGLKPTYDKLRYAICEILKEVDFNTGAETKDTPFESENESGEEEEEANEEEGANGVSKMSEQAASQSKSTNKRKNILKVKGKLKEERLKPTDDTLRDAISEILIVVDFNTTTFNDVLKLLNERFNTDLNPRKSSIKVMVQDELIKLADQDEEDEEEDEGDADKDKKPSSTQGVKA